nr:ribonuclease H-like domain-containing protein [Tanacetum cinerariifolium]
MDQPNPTFAKIPILDTGKFEQWKFRIQQYLQNEHYALWEVIEFGGSYKALPEETDKGPTSESSTKKKGRTVVITTEDMHKRRNDVKARKTLLLALPDEHKLRFNRLQAIVSHLEFMDVEIEQDDLNQKFLTSLTPEWLIGKGKVHTASIPTASIQVSTVSTDVAAASLSHDTVCAYIASQLNGSQIKYEDITQIDEDDIEEMDINWNMALLSMRADRFWKKTSKKITIQGSDVAGFDKSKEEEPAPKALMAIDGIGWDWSYMANEEENHALVADDETCLPEFVDDTVTDYSRPTPSIDESKCNTSNNFSVSEHGESSDSIMSKPMIKFVKAADCPGVIKTNKTETARKSPVKYAEMYRNTSKTPKETREKLLRPQLVGFGDLNKTLLKKGNIDDKGYWDSGCSRHMTCNISYLSEYEPYDGGYVSFGQGERKITGKGIIKTGKLEFKNVYFVKELKYNLFSVS